MKVTILPGPIKGHISAIPSKSHLHRLLICAALSDKECLLRCEETQAIDIKATIGCLTVFGAKITWTGEGFLVTPINRNQMSSHCILPCEESGSLLRFIVPVVCALGLRGDFHMTGRLPERPMAPLSDELVAHGAKLWKDKPDIMSCEGRITAGDYKLPGDISSQYITGLLLALSLLEESSTLTVTKPIESADYIEMTLEAMAAFGVVPEIQSDSRQVTYHIKGAGEYVSPGEVDVEGDWSNGAFWLVAGAMPGGDISLSGLKKLSSQGDREVCDILSQMGANVRWGESSENDTNTNQSGELLLISEGTRQGITIDARAIPDLIPVLSAVAAVGKGTTIVQNAARLRLKESDRLISTTQTLKALGADITETEDGLIIQGKPELTGGTVDSFGDHRIPMTAAIASAACKEPVTIIGAEAVNKSYPGFWDALKSLGKTVIEE